MSEDQFTEINDLRDMMRQQISNVLGDKPIWICLSVLRELCGDLVEDAREDMYTLSEILDDPAIQ